MRFDGKMAYNGSGIKMTVLSIINVSRETNCDIFRGGQEDFAFTA